ncbi:hypothetical protein BGZ65_009144, partial [Modicella reniformis]
MLPYPPSFEEDDSASSNNSDDDDYKKPGRSSIRDAHSWAGRYQPVFQTQTGLMSVQGSLGVSI